MAKALKYLRKLTMIGHGFTPVNSKAGTFRDKGAARGGHGPRVHTARAAARIQFSKNIAASSCQRSIHGLFSTSECPMPRSKDTHRTVPTRGGMFPERWRTQ